EGAVLVVLPRQALVRVRECLPLN
ncbi:MAG: hypothetical protein QOG74_30, partial [Alphaproteobacteria bacterium]|nr:hypothetical protein [Alphaproteobacteria bacterium]